MVFDNVNVLAVIPARGGSVGVPRKNLARVGGRTLIAHVADVTKALPWIRRAVLSTDDAEIREEGLRSGLECPFMRPADLATSQAVASDVLFHAWSESERHYGMTFDFALYLEPTSPLRRPEDIERTLSALMSGNLDSALTVSVTPAHFAPEKCLMRDDLGRLKFYVPVGVDVRARQSLPTYYHRNGAAYAVRREPFFRHRKIVTSDATAAVVLDRPLVNIDDAFELEMAEWLLSRATARQTAI